MDWLDDGMDWLGLNQSKQSIGRTVCDEDDDDDDDDDDADDDGELKVVLNTRNRCCLEIIMTQNNSNY